MFDLQYHFKIHFSCDIMILNTLSLGWLFNDGVWIYYCACSYIYTLLHDFMDHTLIILITIFGYLSSWGLFIFATQFCNHQFWGLFDFDRLAKKKTCMFRGQVWAKKIMCLGEPNHRLSKQLISIFFLLLTDKWVSKAILLK